LVGGAPFLVVPLGGLGVPGRVNFGFYGSYIDAQSWAAATATPTIGGSPVLDDYGVPFVTTGYDARTPGGAGAVKLVAPAGLMSTLGGNLPLHVKMTINFKGSTPTPTPTVTPTPTPTPTPTVTPTSTPTPTPPPVRKVALCHKGEKTISVGASAVPGHMRHGDTLGPCP
jgi:hypothetical protein